jgi:hypothetical protein
MSLTRTFGKNNSNKTTVAIRLIDMARKSKNAQVIAKSS